MILKSHRNFSVLILATTVSHFPHLQAMLVWSVNGLFSTAGRSVQVWLFGLVCGGGDRHPAVAVGSTKSQQRWEVQGQMPWPTGAGQHLRAGLGSSLKKFLWADRLEYVSLYDMKTAVPLWMVVSYQLFQNHTWHKLDL